MGKIALIKIYVCTKCLFRKSFVFSKPKICHYPIDPINSNYPSSDNFFDVGLTLSFSALIMKYNLIAIEGNIGAGKTTLSQILAKKLQAKLVLEEFAENPFLAVFYKNPKQYAFPLELSFMTERFTQLKELSFENDLFRGVTVTDYMFTKCLLFAKVNLPSEEYKLYQKLFDILRPQLPQPDILIYLHASAKKLQQNIKKRNREYEQSIPDQYLLKIEEMYVNYIHTHQTATLFIKADNADFESKEEHLEIILSALEKDYTAGRHYLALP